MRGEAIENHALVRGGQAWMTAEEFQEIGSVRGDVDPAERRFEAAAIGVGPQLLGATA